ncbi:hypothetical protein M758_5G179500 [Ceratodon purpureus]|nr:hypothetical protein M758_5G179500 [Ceratodon purpureus]
MIVLVVSCGGWLQAATGLGAWQWRSMMMGSGTRDSRLNLSLRRITGSVTRFPHLELSFPGEDVGRG